MKELIKLTQQTLNNETVNAVSARELYDILGMDKSNWSRWYKKNIVDNPFAEEHVDWEGFVTMTNGNETLDFMLSLELAKKLAMQTRSQVGEDVRQYFIECEKQLVSSKNLKENLILAMVMAEGTVNRALAVGDYEEQYVRPLENKVKEQSQDINRMKPKEEFYDIAVDSTSTFSMQEVAKVLNFKNMGRNKLFAYLRGKGILNKYNIPYQQHVDAGRFKLIETTWNNPKTGEAVVDTKVVVYQKGVDYISKLLTKDGYDRNV